MAQSIVQVNVSLQLAPAPATLQQSGALISQGATNLTKNQSAILTQLSDLTPLLNGSKTFSAMSWSGGLVTATTTAPHGYTISDTLLLTISGVAPSGYNGTFLVTITGASTLTYAVAATLGSVTVQGAYTPEDVAELLSMATTYFAQGNTQAVWVLELGAGNANDGVAALTAYLIANPNNIYAAYAGGSAGYFYAYLVPREWDAVASYLALIASYESPTARTYFFTTTTLASYTAYTNLMKGVYAIIESPLLGVYPANALTAISWTLGVVTATTTTAHGVVPGDWFQISGVTPAGYNGWFLAQTGTAGSTIVYNVAATLGVESVLGTLVASYYANAGVSASEFSCASWFYAFLKINATSTNRATPMAYSFLYGVTPFPTRGNSALITTLTTANIDIVGTGAEGGISTAMALNGAFLNGFDATIWYSIDWVQINVDLNVANAVINGSNSPLNPLYYNQDGINRLQAVAASTIAQGVAYGLVVGQPTQVQLDGSVFVAALNAGNYAGLSPVNAVPFLTYTQENPSAYAAGSYGGFSIAYVPARGFKTITFNVLASFFTSV